MSREGKEVVDPDIKRKINAEGYEGNAAVLIGKEGGEMDGLRERTETGRWAVDLEGYIRKNKEVLATKETVAASSYPGLQPGSACLGERGHLSYIDRNGEVAHVFINNEEIGELKGAIQKTPKSILEGLGFTFNVDSDVFRQLIANQKRRDEEAIREQRKEGFDF